MFSSASFLERWRRRNAAESTTVAATDDAHIPIALITGCPRSGTTAVLGWLGSQRGVVARDETRMLLAAHRFLDEVDRFTALDDARQRIVPALRSLCWSQVLQGTSPSTRLLVEKEPLERVALPDGHYDAFLRHVRELLPALRIVFMVRHPVDTVSSMRNRRWGHSLTSGEAREIAVPDAIATWRANAAIAARLRDDPGTLVCIHGELVSQPLEYSGRIARHLGLEHVTSFSPRRARPLVLSEAEQAEVLAATSTERAWFGM